MSLDIFTIIFGAVCGIIALAVSIIRHQIAVRFRLIDKRIDELKNEVHTRHNSIKSKLDFHVNEDKTERLKLLEEIQLIKESIVEIKTTMKILLNGRKKHD